MELIVTKLGTGAGTPERIDKWRSYNVTLSLKGASHFNVSVPPTKENRALLKDPGKKFDIRAYGSQQFTGLIDERNEHTGTSATDMQVSGRSFQGLLMDSSVPKEKRSILNLTVAEVAARLSIDIWPSFITSVVSDNAANRYIAAGGSNQSKAYPAKADTELILVDDGGGRFHYKEVQKSMPAGAKPSTAPYKLLGQKSPYYAGTGSERFRTTRIPVGSSCWGVIADLGQQIGIHAWMACDGTIILSRPNYRVSPEAYGQGIVLKWDSGRSKATGGNVMGVEYERTIAHRKSEYEVIGLGKSKKTARAKGMFLSGGTIKDPSPAFWARTDSPPYLGASRLYKPGEIQASNCQDIKRLTRFARRQVLESALAGLTIRYELDGHRSDSGTMYVPDSTIKVHDERNNLYGTYYITEVTRSYDMNNGKNTKLNLWPCGLWLDNDDPSTPDDQWYEAIVPKVDW
jgi:prophage tail gpP-like protein